MPLIEDRIDRPAQADREILCWDLADQAMPKALPTLSAHAARVDSLAVSPQRNLLASASTDGRAQLWDIADATHPAPVTTLDIAPYKDSNSSQPPNGSRPLHRVAFNPSGQYLATPGATDSGNNLHLWDLADPRAPRRIESAYESHTDCYEVITSLAFSPIKDYIAGACHGWQVWALLNGVVLSGASVRGQSAQSGLIVFDPGNHHRLLQATDRGVYVWDLSNPGQPGAEAFLASVPTLTAQLAFRSAGPRQLLAVQTLEGSALWDLTDLDHAQVLALTPRPAPILGADIELSPDGTILAAAEIYGNGTLMGLRLRSTTDPTGQPLATIDDLDNGIAEVAFSPTKPILAVSDFSNVVANNHAPPSIRIYDIADPRHPRQVARLVAKSESIAFTPDGEVLTVRIDNYTKPDDLRPVAGPRLRSWDLSDPERPTELWTRQLPPDAQYANFAYRPDGALFAIYETSGTLRAVARRSA